MISLKDGIHVDANEEIVMDARTDKTKINFVSHAHADHSLRTDTEVIASDITRKLAEKRNNVDLTTIDRDIIELKNSGHIIGSRAALVKGNKKVLYTGDVSTSERLYLKGFKPVDADILVIESTYGISSYSLPEQSKVVKNISNWMSSTDRTQFLFGYSLGKAQKLNYIAQQFPEKRILVHGAIEKMNNVLEKENIQDFRYESYKDNREDIDQDTVVILPSRCSRTDWVEKLVKENHGVKAGFSGWAVNESFKYRGVYDTTFALSDHCGFDDLVELVKKVDPEKVYTHHGFDEAFASYLRKEMKYNARSLKKNQSSLTDF